MINGSYTVLVKESLLDGPFSPRKEREGVSRLIKSVSRPLHDAMNSLRKSFGSNFYQVVAQRSELVKSAVEKRIEARALMQQARVTVTPTETLAAI